MAAPVISSISSIPFHQKKSFVAVDYPGVVEDHKKMLKTLGENESVAKCYAEPTKRLKLHFRPSDPFCQPVHGDRFSTTNLLMRVVKKRKRKQTLDDSTVPAYTLHAEILGVVATTYRFQSMVGFQYLPMQKTEKNGYESLIDKIVPRKLERSSWFNLSVPLFLPPFIFSRFDIPCDYNFKNVTIIKEKKPAGRKALKDAEQFTVDDKANEPSSELICTARRRRSAYAIFVNFGDDIPLKPADAAVNRSIEKICPPLSDKKLALLFEQRPCWTKNGLKAVADFDINHLKVLLPRHAYYFLTGPWRSMWVKFGYDPRKDVAAKKYQVLDFRVRQASAIDDLPIGSKRGIYNYIKPRTLSKAAPPTARLNVDDIALGEKTRVVTDKADTQEDQQKKMAQYKFKPDVLPPYRIMFYQVCDVEIPEVQEIIARNNGAETVCSERDGWCEPYFADKCRAILIRYVQEMCRKQHSYTLADPAPNKKKKKRLRYYQPIPSIAQKTSAISEAELTQEEDFLEMGISSQKRNAVTEAELTQEEGFSEMEVNEMETEVLDYMLDDE